MAQQPETRDWLAWHRAYEDPGSRLSLRLREVQALLADALDRHLGEGEGGVRVVSMCAGQGRDVIGVLADHPRRHEVAATLLELDPRNIAYAEESARDAGLTGVRVLAADAGASDAYAGIVPAEIVLECGVFGNISEDDIRRTVEFTPRLCAPGATVIWTRGVFDQSDAIAERIRGWFAGAGFEELAFVAPGDATFRVGANRLVAPPQPLEQGVRLFTFFR